MNTRDRATLSQTCMCFNGFVIFVEWFQSKCHTVANAVANANPHQNIHSANSMGNIPLANFSDEQKKKKNSIKIFIAFVNYQYYWRHLFTQYSNIYLCFSNIEIDPKIMTCFTANQSWLFLFKLSHRKRLQIDINSIGLMVCERHATDMGSQFSKICRNFIKI